MRRFTARALAALAIVAAPIAAHAGEFDGKWKGSAGSWQVELLVQGANATLTLQCNGSFGNTAPFTFDVPVAANGHFDAWVGGAGTFVRRNVTGNLPTFQIPPGGECGGGTVTLQRS
ncbi:hypothetical protein SAMN02745126_06354 [Enhydrobacter aerosaccus]|uniref:Protease inhibitor Inh n=1 Tax=Enhydrobacter aerosaccus TaxID=225324 RepID=A0A1T4TJF7_9HYPH|nr:hypothetical protein [Enhydrobacter aerosaccus]SKA40438.1 hypothetical protein SAMN02745126_06354 [Enhydrobacter aerosaccus]